MRPGGVSLKLRKKEPALWGRLLVELPRPDRLARRASSRAAAEAEARAQAERKKSKTWNESRYTLTEQMAQDKAARDEHEARKASEKAEEAAKLRAWQSHVDATASPQRHASTPFC